MTLCKRGRATCYTLPPAFQNPLAKLASDAVASTVCT